MENNTSIRDSIPKFSSTICKNDRGGRTCSLQTGGRDAVNENCKSSVAKRKQFLCSTFIVSKESEWFHLVINLRKLNSCVEYNHFKMKGLFLLNELLEKYDYISAKDSYFQYLFARNLKVDKTSMERKFFPISLPVFWSLLSAKSTADFKEMILCIL